METYLPVIGWPKTSRVQIPRRAFYATSCVGAVLGSIFVANAACPKILCRCGTSIRRKSRHQTAVLRLFGHVIDP